MSDDPLYIEMAKVFEREEFDDSAALFLTVRGGELRCSPVGGTFQKGGHFQGEEVYEMMKYLMDAAKEFNGNLEEDQVQ